jgi:hypothetical protein
MKFQAKHWQNIRNPMLYSEEDLREVRDFLAAYESVKTGRLDEGRGEAQEQGDEARATPVSVVRVKRRPAGYDPTLPLLPHLVVADKNKNGGSSGEDYAFKESPFILPEDFEVHN